MDPFCLAEPGAFLLTGRLLAPAFFDVGVERASAAEAE